MKKYTVKGVAVFHSGKRYAVGETIELDDATAAVVGEYLTPVEDDAKAESEAKAKPTPTRKGK